MAAAYQTNGTGSAAAAGSMDITAPASIADNNLLLALISLGSSTTVTPPTGWATLTGVVSNPGSSIFTYTFKKIASSESGNYTFAFSGNVTGSGIIFRISGAHAVSPIDAVGGLGQNASLSVGYPSVNPAGTVDVLFLMFTTAVATTFTAPAAFAEAVDTQVSGYTFELATKTLAASGATGAGNATAANSAVHAGYAVAVWNAGDTPNSYSYAPAGIINTRGSAPSFRSFPHSSSGNIVLSGSPVISRGYFYTVSDGTSLSGSPVVRIKYFIAASGTNNLGGAGTAAVGGSGSASRVLLNGFPGIRKIQVIYDYPALNRIFVQREGFRSFD